PFLLVFDVPNEARCDAESLCLRIGNVICALAVEIVRRVRYTRSPLHRFQSNGDVGFIGWLDRSLAPKIDIRLAASITAPHACFKRSPCSATIMIVSPSSVSARRDVSVLKET